jgi:hypothetical protein
MIALRFDGIIGTQLQVSHVCRTMYLTHTYTMLITIYLLIKLTGQSHRHNGGPKQVFIIRSNSHILVTCHFRRYISHKASAELYWSLNSDWNPQCRHVTELTRRVWRYQRGNQNPYIKEEHTTRWWNGHNTHLRESIAWCHKWTGECGNLDIYTWSYLLLSKCAW